jgi:hypothetical protein
MDTNTLDDINNYNGISLNIDYNKDVAQYNIIDKNIIAGNCRTTGGTLFNIAQAKLQDSDVAKADTYKDKFNRDIEEIKILTETGDGLNIFMDNFTCYGLTHKCHINNNISEDGDVNKKSLDVGFNNSNIRLF